MGSIRSYSLGKGRIAKIMTEFPKTTGTEPERIPIKRDRFGGFWIRVAAYIVDTIVLLIPTLLASFLYRSLTPANDPIEKSIVETVDGILNIGISWIYFAGLWSSPWQASLGQKICGLRIVDFSGERISFGRATGRFFATFLSLVFLCIGFVMIAWTSRRQGLHDLIAETYVLKANRD